jgi:hypothetical protein
MTLLVGSIIATCIALVAAAFYTIGSCGNNRQAVSKEKELQDLRNRDA